jgi:hypothetical protein
VISYVSGCGLTIMVGGISYAYDRGVGGCRCGVKVVSRVRWRNGCGVSCKVEEWVWSHVRWVSGCGVSCKVGEWVRCFM